MLRKIAEIKVPKGAGPREAKTNPIFATYDRQGAAFAFYFSDSNIAGAAANLLFMVDGQKVFVDDGATLGETNETHTFTYPLPDKLLNYTGKVDGYLYFDFEDGSHSDEIHFVFTIKKSQIDETMEDAPDVYIKSFDEIKADVQSTADKATSDIKSRVDAVENAKNSTVGEIEKAKDDAESQIGDYVGEVESAKQDISSSVSDVQSKSSEASEDISDLVKTTEDARDEAVESMYEIDYSNRNLLTGTSDEWEKLELTGWTYDSEVYDLEELGLSPGDTITYSCEVDNTLDELEQDIYARVDFFEDYKHSGVKLDTDKRLKRIHPGEKGIAKNIIIVPSKAVGLRVFKAARGHNEGNKKVNVRKHKLQRGKYATDWKPNPSEIVTTEQYEKLKNAIINLGGSI